ncbi:MAG: porin family protein, partial [Bacteroidota bacterium]|nr:porin family protein [Bacteroidota bacterium]
MKKSLFISLFLLVSITYNTLSAQYSKLSDFDDKMIHFGFALSYNNSDYYIQRSLEHQFADDSLQSLIVASKPGFTLGVISSINFNPNFKLRFAIPSLSFQERDLEYTYLDPSNGATYMLKKAIRPVYLEFPAMFKFRTDRIENWAAYGITGIRFGIDMASDKDVNNLSASPEDQIVKIKKTDFGFEVGGGFDFFLEYFKFGIELKLGAGMMNLHLDENTSFDNPIDFLR